MAATLIRSRALVTHAIDRHSWNEIPDGAVLQRDGVIAAIGGFPELAAANPDVPVIGTGREIVLPGFVNGHHHVGLTPVQLGSPDLPLELWLTTKMIARKVSLYLDTLYSAFEMIASGVTTVQHIHGVSPGGLQEASDASDEVIRAYDDIGMRTSFSFMLRDQNRLVHQQDEAFAASLPEALQAPMRRWFGRYKMDLNDNIALFEGLHGRYGGKPRTRIQLAPANLHWCSDTALARLSDVARKYDVPLHMHLAETPLQKEYARRRGGCTPVEYIARFDLLGPKMTLGHGVWVSESDIERIAETGTCVCHNCSSNFRLRSGTMPLNRMEAAGITTAIGIDEAGLNDDRDMLQEMRLVLRAHRVPGLVDDEVPTVAQVFRMATEGGGATTGFNGTIGRLEVGKAADLVMMDWRQISYPYLDEAMPLLDAVLLRAKTEGVRTVICDGEVIYQDGRFTRVDRDQALEELHAELSVPFTDDELERRSLSRALLPHIRKFYETYGV
ncbi:amidohydrolase family protein [Phenylobacterium sp.]|uniref:amidohydrolase family protein n=1 Tax=Phenylobacterium sp. TaxID=1871053 RepID=UPI002629D409|nr:amidohydrolase family protein [Phenylobacterium sp.]